MREAEAMGGKKIGGKSGEEKWGVGYVNGWAARLVRKMPFHSRHSTHTTHVTPRLWAAGTKSERARLSFCGHNAKTPRGRRIGK